MQNALFAPRAYRYGVLSASIIKLLACILMTIDHVGVILYPRIQILRIIGRLAFPLFAFFIAEGCHYTKNKLRRFLMMAGIGVAYLLFFYLYEGKVQGSIFLTFSASILMIYLLDFCKVFAFRNFRWYKPILAILLFSAATVLSYYFFKYVHSDYGFYGMLVPVFVSLFDFKDITPAHAIRWLDSHPVRLLCLAVGLILVWKSPNTSKIQVYSLLSLVPLALYNGKLGFRTWKYGFYLFYPLHLAVLEGIAMLINYLKA